MCPIFRKRPIAIPGDDYSSAPSFITARRFFARAVERGLLDPKLTIQIGYAGGVNDIVSWRFSHEKPAMPRRLH